jgi:hypothetical protein
MVRYAVVLNRCLEFDLLIRKTVEPAAVPGG